MRTHCVALALQNRPERCVTAIAGICLAREKQGNVRVIPTSTAIAQSVELAHEFSNRVLRRIGREFPRVGMSASGHRSRCYSAGS